MTTSMSAPPDKKAVYMGYSNIPYAIGWGLGNLVSGFLYDEISSKVVLAFTTSSSRGRNRAIMSRSREPKGKTLVCM